ncbi:capsule biosynthesis protein [Alteromonas ponticola]|uniref:Capsule biosynthesis protein n=1 Tax=Alteromonas aquimaris TaxID=2998417 RepID=A0ABT3P420_9ALTE|nr:capsule biosynthesis protein [Alteromonas aquimaris]MCW8107512.1 capsule biosynthesis protein [Alteromonas aquimaris]
MTDKLTKIKAFILRRPSLLVLSIWLIYAFYLTFIASNQFESESKLIIKASDGGSAFDPSSLLPGLSVGTPSDESDVIIAFIESADMANYLDETLGVRKHYSSTDYDFFSRLPANASREEFQEFYRNHIEVYKDDLSSIISLQVRAFSPEFAQLINKTVISQAEKFVNKINNDLAVSKLEFAKKEHQKIEEKLRQAKTDLLSFQSEYEVLDPTMQGAALQQLTFSLEATLAQKQTELNALSTIMSPKAPEIMAVQRQIKAIQNQIAEQKNKVVKGKQLESQLSTTELMARFSNIKIELELALQAYSTSLMSLENIRVETYEQFQHLVTVDNATLPDKSQYPDILYNLVLFGLILFMIYGVTRIVIATIREL